MAIVTKHQIISLISQTTEESYLAINDRITDLQKQIEETGELNPSNESLSKMKKLGDTLEQLRAQSMAIGEYDTALKNKVINFFK